MVFSHYRNDRGIPQATQATIDLVKWVTLNGPTKGYIPKDALLYQDPAIRTEEFDRHGRPSTIDWTVSADWYDREVHWRGFTPSLEEELHIWRLSADHIAIDVRSPSSFIIDLDIAKKCIRQIASLFDIITDINTVLSLPQDKVKAPPKPSTQPFDRKHGSEGAVMGSLAVVRRGFLDGLAYFCWVQTVFEEQLSAANIPNRIAQKSEPWMHYLGREKTGYLFDLSRHWREISLGYYVAKNIPVHYMWTPQLQADPRFARLSPNFLNARDQLIDDSSSIEIMVVSPLPTTEMRKYDQWLQAIIPPEKPNALSSGTKNHYIIDFDGWTRRVVPIKKLRPLYAKKFFYRDLPALSGATRIYYRYRPVVTTSSSYEDEEDDDDYGDDGAEDVHVVRERYKFLHGPVPGHETDQRTGLRVRIPAPNILADYVEKAFSEQSLSAPQNLASTSEGVAVQAVVVPVSQTTATEKEPSKEALEDKGKDRIRHAVQSYEPTQPFPSTIPTPRYDTPNPPTLVDNMLEDPHTPPPPPRRSLSPNLSDKPVSLGGSPERDVEMASLSLLDRINSETSSNDKVPQNLTSLADRMDVVVEAPSTSKSLEERISRRSRSRTPRVSRSRSRNRQASPRDRQEQRKSSPKSKPTWRNRNASPSEGRSRRRQRSDSSPPSRNVRRQPSPPRLRDSYRPGPSRRQGNHQSSGPPQHRGPTLTTTAAARHHPTPPQTVATVSYHLQTYTTNVQHRWASLPRPLIDPSSRMYPGALGLTWSEAYLAEGILHFDDHRSETRIRLWSLLNRSLTKAQLLEKALNKHVGFSLEVPRLLIPSFSRHWTDADKQAGVFYRSGYRDALMQLDSDKNALCLSYKGSIATLLARPNARAFFFRGGIISRIARAFAPPSLLQSIADGPSAQVVLHNAGNTSLDRSSQTDEVTPWEIEILLGTCLPSQGKNVKRTLWPAEQVFDTHFTHWDGEWNDKCEEWFGTTYNYIMRGESTPVTAAEWQQRIRGFLRLNPCPNDFRIETRVWEAAASNLSANLGGRWEGKPFGQIIIPEPFIEDQQ
jgi:hypothetical protein